MNAQQRQSLPTMKTALSLIPALIIIGFSLPADAQTNTTQGKGEPQETLDDWARRANREIMRTAKPGEIRLTFAEPETPEQKRANEKKWREDAAREETARKAAELIKEREQQVAHQAYVAYQQKKLLENENFARELKEAKIRGAAVSAEVRKKAYGKSRIPPPGERTASRQ
jgi:hypothetical protein